MGKSLGQRKKVGLIVAAAVACLAGAYLWLPYAGLRSGMTEANAHRISVGMTRGQVEAILGAPNEMFRTRKQEGFWDAYTTLGRHYVAMSVTYDDNQYVAKAKFRDFWWWKWD